MRYSLPYSQALSVADEEKASLKEKLEKTMAEINMAGQEYEKLKRESNTRADQDNVTILSLETDKASLENKVKELQ